MDQLLADEVAIIYGVVLITSQNQHSRPEEKRLGTLNEFRKNYRTYNMLLPIYDILADEAAGNS